MGFYVWEYGGCCVPWPRRVSTYLSRPEEHAWFRLQPWSAEWKAVPRSQGLVRPRSDDLFVSSFRSEFLVH